MTRPSWDEYFLKLVVDVAARGECVRRQVGAVLVDQRHYIVATGYNGVDAGATETCLTGHCPRALSGVAPYSPYTNCIARHAEDNCIRQAMDRYGGAWFEGLTMYVSCEPCADCYTLIAKFNIDTVKWPGGYA